MLFPLLRKLDEKKGLFSFTLLSISCAWKDALGVDIC